MTDDDRFSVEAARDAAARDELDEWVRAFLASPGSDNDVLGEELTKGERWWLGPVRVPLRQLHRLVGPPDQPVLCPVDEDDWRDGQDDLEEKVREGWEPPPVIASHRGDHLMLEDGNHRVEAVRRAGAHETWVVIAFGDPAARETFAAGLASST